MSQSDLGAVIVQSAQALSIALRARHWTIATAESCTAGGVAYALTTIAGASAWFERGFVTYSNDAKIQMLNVSTASLSDFGAVSEPVARAMALGALSHSSAHTALAVTGIAGPDGGAPEKPVGTVCFAWAIRRPRPWVHTATRHFEGDRAAVRSQTIISVLDSHLALIEQHAPI